MAHPGPPPFGRSVIIVPGAPIPAAWAGAAVVPIDESTLRDPAATVQRLHRCWIEREPVVIELAVDPITFRTPASVVVEPWTIGPAFEPWFDRLHHLVWSNAYDARAGAPVWWWSRKAARLGATEDTEGATDIVLADGIAAWVDGGPRRPFAPDEVGGAAIVHADSVSDGMLACVPPACEPAADLAVDQLAAVAHGSGPARVIAPAGSGKTRVLTERLRYLRRDRGYGRGDVLAVAYNKQAQLELEERTQDVSPRIRTLNSLGLSVLTAHRGAAPQLMEDRDVRRVVEKVAPIGRRRANTDPVAPYVEALSLVRLGLRDPAEIEASRDDVANLAEVFLHYRRHLVEHGTVDFDEQIYGAVVALLADGPFRRRMQATCRHVLIDEFQDLTPAHVLLLRLLALPALDVFAVGDDDQVIYEHAGADPAFLIDFADLFPGAATHPLTFNYRCPVEVVTAAATLLEYNHRRVPKRIEAGPTADTTAGAFRVIEHQPDAGARALVDVVTGWMTEDDGVETGDIAVLVRVNSLLLAPHVALHEAGVPLRSELRPNVLDRTGLRAALAYLRIAGSGGQIAGDDIVEILRRPSRGLPPWFSERLGRRSAWTTPALRRIAATVPDKDADKVERLVDDVELLVDAADGGTTREVLLAVRDIVGLGQAMGMLDRTGSGQGSSHLDDLEALLQVADLHPDVATFETWLRQVFQREVAENGVTLSTVHRVKGREWDRVAVFGVSSGILPHRLTEDREEERRVLHVAITRGRHRVAVLGDRSRRSPFLDELSGVAPKLPVGGKAAATKRILAVVPADTSRPAASKPAPLTGAAAATEVDLRSWRTVRSRADGVPAYVVLTDRSLQGIATVCPATLAELLACEGIGPAKLENYGEEILAIVARSGGV